MNISPQKLERKKELLRKFCMLIGADFSEEKNTFNITLPDNAAVEFKNSRLKLVLKPSYPSEDSSHMPEELFLEKLYQICLKRGKVASFIIDKKATSIDTLDKLKFINVRAERNGSYSYIKKALIFHFQVSINQPENWRKIYQIPIDPYNFKIIDWISEEFFFTSPLKPLETRKRVLSNKKLQEAYKNTIFYLKGRLEDDLADFKLRNRQHLQSALNKISNYYSRLRVDEKKRIELLESQVKKIEDKIKKHRSLQTFSRYLTEKRRLTVRIEEEKGKLSQYLDKIELFELKEKNRETERHEIICNIDLIAVSLLHYRLIREMILLYNNSSKAILNVYVIPSASKVESPICKSCEKPAENIGLCSNSHIVCSQCLDECSMCNKKIPK